jgi:A/G-specific adenine glycosylase
MNISKKTKQEFASTLLDWFRLNSRDFPWRKTKNPYRLIIAEIMLQRTRAEKVEPTYRKFVRELPDFEALATCDLKRINELIKPLGLRKRARLIKEMAEDVVNKYNGKLPREAERLLELKGVGYYAANAVLCLAYGEDRPMVDWTVSRVFGRVFDIRIGKSPHTDKKFLEFVSQFIPKGKGKEFNLALLDLAAKICKPKNPECDICPLNNLCEYSKMIFPKSNLP